MAGQNVSAGNKRYANMTNQPVHPAELDYY